jgi:hypothetical protein
VADYGLLRIASTLGTFAADDWHVLMPLEGGGGGEREEKREECYWSCCKGARTRTRTHKHTHTHYAHAHTRTHILTHSLTRTHTDLWGSQTHRPHASAAASCVLMTPCPPIRERTHMIS